MTQYDISNLDDSRNIILTANL